MKRFRDIIFWCHLTLGVLAGIIILIMCVTGVLLAYEKQITYWADTHNYSIAPPQPGAARLGVEALVARAREMEPKAAPTTITIRSDEGAPATVGFAGGRNLFLDPYTGAVLGDGAPGMRAFFRWVTDWHRWLGAQGENRTAARAITGACNLGFLFIVMSGIYLWWPRKWSRKLLRNITWFRRGLPGKARDFNWHNTLGFWSAIPLFIVVLSGVVISYTWAGNLVYKLAGESPPAPQQQRPPQQQGGAAPQVITNGLDSLWARAEQQSPDWRIISLQLPTSMDAPVTFTLDNGTGGQPQKRAQLALNRATGEVVRWEPFSGYTTGRRLRSILRFAHTGEVAGIPGQTIAAIASAGGSFLVITGLALAWRRFYAWRGRRKKAGDESPDAPAEVEAEA